MESSSLSQNLEITAKFNTFVEAVLHYQKTCFIEAEKGKISSFLSSLFLDLEEFPDEKAIKMIFEANLCNMYFIVFEIVELIFLHKRKKSPNSEKKWKKDQTILLVWIIYYMIQIKSLSEEEELVFNLFSVKIFIFTSFSNCRKYYGVRSQFSLEKSPLTVFLSTTP